LTLVRKSDFAQKCRVSAPRVSQWLTEGKIDGAAVVGTGQRAMLDAGLAREQLRERLAVDERFGQNGLARARRARPGCPHAAPAVRVIPEGETDSTVEARLKAEKLRQSAT
jgi:hypothetical protein